MLCLSLLNTSASSTVYFFLQMIATLLTSLLVLRGGAGKPSTESPIRAGLSFTPKFRLLLSGQSYIVPLVLKSNDIQKPLIEALNMTADLSYNIAHMSMNYPLIRSMKATLQSFDMEFHRAFKNLNSFLRYVINTDPEKFSRSKRGLINILGSLSNSLFGTATQSQIDAIHNQLIKDRQINEEQRRILNLHNQVLNITTRNMQTMHSALQRLSSAVNTSFSVLREFSSKTLQLEGEQRLLKALFDIELALGLINDDILELKIGLQSLLQTFITPSIISDSKLLEILRTAAVHPSGLLFPAVTEYLSLYRDLIRVTSRPTYVTNTRNFYLTIPLRGNPSDTFDVFRVDSLPFSLPNSTLFAYYLSNYKYFAITENRKAYFPLIDLDHCSKHDSLLVCPPLGPIYDSTISASCESASFLNQASVTDLCHARFVKTFPPLFIKGQGYWTFSLASPIHLTLTCPTNAVNKHSIHLEGSGILTIRHGCSAHSSALSLPADDVLVEGPPISVSLSELPTTLPRLPHDVLKSLNNTRWRAFPGPTDVGQLVPIPGILGTDGAGYAGPPYPYPSPDLTAPPSVFRWLSIGITLGLVLLCLALLGVGFLRIRPWLRNRLQQEAWQLVTVRPSTRPQGRGLRRGGVCRAPREPEILEDDNPPSATESLTNRQNSDTSNEPER